MVEDYTAIQRIEKHWIEETKKLIDEIATLKQENEELKAKVKNYGKINEQETKDYAELLKTTNSYRRALEEIREYTTGDVEFDDIRLILEGELDNG